MMTSKLKNFWKQSKTPQNNNNNSNSNNVGEHNEKPTAEKRSSLDAEKLSNFNSYIRERLELVISIYPKLPFKATFVQKNKGRTLKKSLSTNSIKLIEEFETAVNLAIPMLAKEVFFYKSFKERLLSSQLLISWYVFVYYLILILV
jgi:hypothetical protein